ncbi:glycosyltransferase 87 family protein [Nocardia beijingensis]|uniref:Glycosyltransferase 87 family protein n=1 Tax=Nocardia beijingensis TaxID=95162 RepID=A0ABW7WDA2_9NOCA
MALHGDEVDEVAVSTRWAVLALAIGGCALIVQAVLVPLWAAPQFGLLVNQGDLEIYRNGALQLLHQKPLYAAPVPPGGWFTYPPFAAMCFVPLALLSFGTARIAVFAITCFALWATIWRCWRVLGYRGDGRLAVFCLGLAAVAVDIEAVRGTLWQGQVNLVLMAIIVWDLTGPASARFRGWSVGIATGVKLTAIVFVPYLIVTRQWRAAAMALTTTAATMLLAWLVAPSDSREYWLRAVRDTDRIGPVTHPGNQSINGVLANIWAPATVPTWVWLLCVSIAAAIGFAAASAAYRLREGLLGLVVTGLIGCAIPPLAWGHHWVWFVPLLIVLSHYTIRERSRHRTILAATTAASALAASMWFTAGIFAEIERLDLTGAPSYVPAMNAAVEQIPQWGRAVVCGVPPTVYLTVVIAVLVYRLRSRRARNTVDAQPPIPVSSHN